MSIKRKEFKKISKKLKVDNYEVEVECKDNDCTITVLGRTWRARGSWEEICIPLTEAEDLCLKNTDIF